MPKGFQGFQPGGVANPKGRPKGIVSAPKGNHGRPAGQQAAAFVNYDLQQAAKSHCEEGLQILMTCARDKNAGWPQRLQAIAMLWERGYGRPEITAHINTEHRFVVAPETMDEASWLARKGQPVGAAGDKWLQAHQARAGVVEAVATEKRISGAPTQTAGHSTGPRTIEAEAEDAMLLDPDPTMPAPDGTKLN